MSNEKISTGHYDSWTSNGDRCWTIKHFEFREFKPKLISVAVAAACGANIPENIVLKRMLPAGG